MFVMAARSTFVRSKLDDRLEDRVMSQIIRGSLTAIELTVGSSTVFMLNCPSSLLGLAPVLAVGLNHMGELPDLRFVGYGVGAVIKSPISSLIAFDEECMDVGVGVSSLSLSSTSCDGDKVLELCAGDWVCTGSGFKADDGEGVGCSVVTDGTLPSFIAGVSVASELPPVSIWPALVGAKVGVMESGIPCSFTGDLIGALVGSYISPALGLLVYRLPEQRPSLSQT